MPYTRLGITGVPGRNYSFSAKTAAPTAGPHTGDFTELSVLGVPGKQHSFLAKDPAVVSTPRGPNAYTRLSITATPGRRYGFQANYGLFTELSNIAVPGKRHRFRAKKPVIVVEEPEEILGPPDKYTGEKYRLYQQVLREDEEILSVILSAVTKGLLEQ